MCKNLWYDCGDQVSCSLHSDQMGSLETTSTIIIRVTTALISPHPLPVSGHCTSANQAVPERASHHLVRNWWTQPSRQAVIPPQVPMPTSTTPTTHPSASATHPLALWMGTPGPCSYLYISPALHGPFLIKGMAKRETCYHKKFKLFIHTNIMTSFTKNGMQKGVNREPVIKRV